MINPYKFDLKNPNIFSIDTPPPTVSGHLHMGHVFSYCHADFIARFQRMSGKNVFYPIGFDDNGLPTERLVEKITGVKVGFNFSEKSKETLKTMMGIDFDGVCGKEDFIKICRFVVKDAEIEFEKLFKSINLSVDWDYKYQSISDNSAKIAQTAFANLLSKGLIYQKNAPVYWCTQDKTATANAEIEDKEMKGVQIEFNFDLENGEKIRIMTTRPEMIPACRALLFNHSDERFNGEKLDKNITIKIGDENKEFIGKNYIGKFAINPITGEKIPLLSDQDVKIEKGTGVVMCCTYGDWQDVIWTKRHNLSEKIIVSGDGKITADFAKYTKENGDSDNLKVEDARKKMIEILENSGNLLAKTDITHPVKCAERSGRPLEIIPTPQWYVRVLPFKKVLLQMSKLLKFRPESMRIKLENWINGLSQDWCISRDRFFGIDIPCSFKNKHFGDQNQVLDTWFTSGLSPHLSNILHENFADRKKDVDFTKSPIGSMSLRPQAHEIIRTWTFVTLVQSYLNLGVEIINESEAGSDIFDLESDEIEINGEFAIAKIENFGKTVYLKCKKPDEKMLPWENVMLSGWCLASDKTKMSKSKGNIVTPTGLIEDFGSDAVRYWAGSSTLGADTAYNEGQIKVGQKLVTKLKNASKLCLQTISGSQILSKTHDEILKMQDEITNENDLAIIQKAKLVMENYKSAMLEYEYSKAIDVVEKFFWNDFCDNYLELAKTRSYGLLAQIYQDKNLSDEEKNDIIFSQNSSAIAMYICLLFILTHFAVFLPNICDQVYLESIFKEKLGQFSIHEINTFEKIKITTQGKDSIEIFDKIVQILNEVRKAKSEKSLSIKAEVLEIFASSDIFNKISNTKASLDLLFASNCNQAVKESNNEICVKI